jgi:hypothetical protein
LASLAALGLSGRVLVVLGDEDGYADRSFGNLPEIQTMVSGELNAYDILVNDWVVFTDETVPGGVGNLVEGGVEAAGSNAGGATTDTATEDAADTATEDVADDTATADVADDSTATEEEGSGS